MDQGSTNLSRQEPSNVATSLYTMSPPNLPCGDLLGMDQGSTNLSRQEPSSDTSSNTVSPPNLPRGDLLGSRYDYNKFCIPLYFASLKGDWETAKTLLEKWPNLVRYSITENCDTALHVAASSKSSKLMEIFVENLVHKMEKEDMLLQNRNYNTALCLAAANGNIKIVTSIVKQNRTLLDTPGSQEMLPLQMASLSGKRDVAGFLYDCSKKMTGALWTDQKRCWVLEQCVQAELFGVALKIVEDRPKLTTNGTVLGILARKPHAFKRKRDGEMKTNCAGLGFRIIWLLNDSDDRVDSSKIEAKRLLKIIWSDIVKLPKRRIDDIIIGPPDKIINGDENPTASVRDSSNVKKQHVLFVAAEMGNTKFVIELINRYPDLIWKTNDNNQTIFHVAVSHRHEGIYNLLKEVGSMKDMITHLKDENGNNMLHLAGKSAKNISSQNVLVPALKMQKELLWFKEVEAMIPFSCREEKNNDGFLPRELFAKEHKDLMSKSEKWMKYTASQSMVVAALIATIAFAATFTFPGGYNQNNGIPMFLHQKVFIVFVISDAISLLYSSLSIITFLILLTSRYAEHDFLKLLPYLMFYGQTMLLYSIASMLIAFNSNFFIFYQNSLIWVPILISVFTVINLVSTLYQFGFAFIAPAYKTLFKPKLYYRNPKF